MPDVPDVVQYGKVTGRFVSFRADSSDAGDAPDEVPLTGKVTLTPTVPYMRWRHTTPPRLSAIEPIVCQIVDGNLKAPDGTGDVYVVATDQPDADPNIVQWRASFRFDGSTSQPGDTTFNVPANGEVDLAVVIPAEEQPGVVVVVSAEYRDQAEAAADAAEASALSAANSATTAESAAQAAADDAVAAATVQISADAARAETAATTAEQARDDAEAAAAILGDTGWVALDLPAPWTALETAETPAYRIKNGITYFRGVISHPEITSGFSYQFPLPVAAHPQGSYAAAVPITVGVGVASITGGTLAVPRTSFPANSPAYIFLMGLIYPSN